MHGRQILPMPIHQSSNVADCGVDARRWIRLACVGVLAADSGAQCCVTSFGKLDADHASLTPGNRAASDCRVEEREPLHLYTSSEGCAPSLLARTTPRCS